MGWLLDYGSFCSRTLLDLIDLIRRSFKESQFSFSIRACHRNFCPTKKCPRIKIFRKFLSHGIKIFVLGQNISENFCPTQIKFVLPQNFLEKDEIRAKASLAIARPFCLLLVWLLGREEKVAKRRKGGLDKFLSCAWC